MSASMYLILRNQIKVFLNRFNDLNRILFQSIQSLVEFLFLYMNDKSNISRQLFGQIFQSFFAMQNECKIIVNNLLGSLCAKVKHFLTNSFKSNRQLIISIAFKLLSRPKRYIPAID